LLRILKVEAVSNEGPSAPVQSIDLASTQFPVPGLIYIALKTLLGHASYGPAEKMAWGISAGYGAIRFGFDLEKFGPRLYVPERTDPAMVKEIINALQRCCSVSESYLTAEVALQLSSARVTIRNQYPRFDDAYQFFRSSAKDTYASDPPAPVVTETAFGTMTSSEPFRPQQHGGYLASAMIDSYFSKLEHALVLMSAFSFLELENGGLQRFVGDRWDAKFKALFDLQSDRGAKRVYDDLKKIKEDLRNPSAHGGFLKNGASFLFHSPAGALPVLLTRTNTDFEFHISPVPPSTFEQVCDVLDGADAFLEECGLAEAFRFAASGLDVAFDPKSRQAYQEAAASGDFDSFMTRQGHLQDMHANMDY
jgi:hypothetical protein